MSTKTSMRTSPFRGMHRRKPCRLCKSLKILTSMLRSPQVRISSRRLSLIAQRLRNLRRRPRPSVKVRPKLGLKLGPNQVRDQQRLLSSGRRRATAPCVTGHAQAKSWDAQSGVPSAFEAFIVAVRMPRSLLLCRIVSFLKCVFACVPAAASFHATSLVSH